VFLHYIEHVVEIQCGIGLTRIFHEDHALLNEISMCIKGMRQDDGLLKMGRFAFRGAWLAQLRRLLLARLKP